MERAMEAQKFSKSNITAPGKERSSFLLADVLWGNWHTKDNQRTPEFALSQAAINGLII